MPAVNPFRPRRDWLVACLVAFGLALAALPGPALAGGDPPKQEDGLPVIAAGREAEVLALFAPFKLGVELSPGWHLESVGIDATSIQVKVLSNTQVAGTLRFALAKRTPSKETTASFSVLRDGDKAAGPALDILVDAVRKNDKGTFWPAAAPVPGPNGEELKPEGYALLPGGEEAAKKAEAAHPEAAPRAGDPPGGGQPDGGATVASARAAKAPDPATTPTSSRSRRRLVLAGALVIAVALLLLGRRAKGAAAPGGSSS